MVLLLGLMICAPPPPPCAMQILQASSFVMSQLSSGSLKTNVGERDPLARINGYVKLVKRLMLKDFYNANHIMSRLHV